MFFYFRYYPFFYYSPSFRKTTITKENSNVHACLKSCSTYTFAASKFHMQGDPCLILCFCYFLSRSRLSVGIWSVLCIFSFPLISQNLINRSSILMINRSSSSTSVRRPLLMLYFIFFDLRALMRTLWLKNCISYCFWHITFFSFTVKLEPCLHHTEELLKCYRECYISY